MACCKITRVAAKYDLTPATDDRDDLSDYLVSRWRGGAESDGSSYRELAAIVNKRLLRTVSIANGRQVTTPQVESEYAALRDGGDSAAEVRSVLAAEGIAVDELEDDFVSHMAVRRHLLDCQNLDPLDSTNEADWHDSSITYARDRFRTVIDDVCESLTAKELVPDAGSAVIQTPIYLRCPECPTRVRLDTAIERGFVCQEHASNDH